MRRRLLLGVCDASAALLRGARLAWGCRREVGRVLMPLEASLAGFVATDEQRYSVELMTSIGIRQDDIAKAIGISDVTLRRHFAPELAVGKTKVIARVADSVIRQALAGNMTAAIFFLKTKAGWREQAAEDLGKKEQREAIARTAERGTDWEALLN